MGKAFLAGKISILINILFMCVIFWTVLRMLVIQLGALGHTLCVHEMHSMTCQFT